MSIRKQPTPAQINASKVFRGFAGPDKKYDGAAHAMPKKTSGPDQFKSFQKASANYYRGGKVK